MLANLTTNHFGRSSSPMRPIGIDCGKPGRINLSCLGLSASDTAFHCSTLSFVLLWRAWRQHQVVPKEHDTRFFTTHPCVRLRGAPHRGLRQPAALVVNLDWTCPKRLGGGDIYETTPLPDVNGVYCHPEFSEDNIFFGADRLDRVASGQSVASRRSALQQT
ncbi:hypothetical protein THAOC_20650 [Thalassiosira oceanica]|uniref:Uncharacterized protein n=1 Tax=Thalassiosira oceanica TaxID=159749 RepID=K0S2Y6_THAOC|nr:hypothetical protein THAOC_20650 [Thalassiosira oceanica]|eukprot:EJK59164.1 hypothetical protein THAOC_20650 [Thalassiosira oceanica]